MTNQKYDKSRGMFYARITTFCLLVLFSGLGCDKYPSNPVQIPEPDQLIELEHTATEYLAVEHHIEGVAASKANMLSFTVQTLNVNAKALEVHGNVTIGGPPYQKEYAFTFRTDSLLIHLDNCLIAQDLIPSIQNGESYSFYRPVLPPNEFSPFEGEQGKVDSIILTNVWSIAEDGSKQAVDFIF